MDGVQLMIVVLVALVVLAFLLAVLWLVIRRYCWGRREVHRQETTQRDGGQITSWGDGRRGVPVPAGNSRIQWVRSHAQILAQQEPTSSRPVAVNQPQLISDNIQLLQGALNKNRSKSAEDANAKLIQQAQQLVKISPPVKHNWEEGYQLIIGVDATPATQAGYCVFLREMRLEYYVVKGVDFPWNLNDPKDTAEFEMKNLMFAVTLWKDEILKYKNGRICLYTDNHALNQVVRVKDKYGQRAFTVLNHYQKVGVSLNWNSMHVNKFRNLEKFARYIQPVDDLSRWRISEGLKFLMDIHGIQQENVFGTHVPAPKKRVQPMSNRGAPRKAWYNETPRYREVIRIVRDGIEDQDCSAPTCVCSDSLRSSLKL